MFTFEPNEYEKVTFLQTKGITCPYCHSPMGHYGTCPLLHMNFPASVDKSENIISDEVSKVEKYRADFEPNSIPSISTEDSIRLLGLGVLWDSMENGTCFHPIC